MHTHRLFVAILPPEPWARWALTFLEGIAPPPGGWRTTPTEQVHLTLQFIGDRRGTEMDRTLESVRRAASGIGPLTLQPTRLVALPRPGPARLIALETTAPPPLLELQHRLAARLARRPRSAPGDRFLPHFTLCRFVTESTVALPDLEIPDHSLEVGEIATIESVLHPAGAEHRVLDRVTLGT